MRPKRGGKVKEFEMMMVRWTFYATAMMTSFGPTEGNIEALPWTYTELED